MAHKLLALQMISISIKNLDIVIKKLVIEMREELQEPPTGFTSEDLRLFMVQKGIYPPEMFYDLFSTTKPHATLTYMWPATPINKFVELLKRRFADEDTVYIDILLNDQRSPVSIQVSLSNANVRCKAHRFTRFSPSLI